MTVIEKMAKSLYFTETRC